MKSYDIAVIPGDGIGREITGEAVAALRRAGEAYGFSLHTEELLAGGCAIDETGVPLPDETLTACRKSDSVLLGAVGGPKWDALPGDMRPERALLGLRSGLSPETSLELTKDLISQPVILERLRKASSILDSGETFSRALTESGLFGGMEGRLITISFYSGSSDETFRRLSRQYTKRSIDLISQAVSIVEPTIVILLSLLVGLVLLSVMMPLLGILSDFAM